jgi:hypothetical protein
MLNKLEINNVFPPRVINLVVPFEARSTGEAVVKKQLELLILYVVRLTQQSLTLTRTVYSSRKLNASYALCGTIWNRS